MQQRRLLQLLSLILNSQHLLRNPKKAMNRLYQADCHRLLPFRL
ncbi:MAG TPA: hypothetical protein [Caudoviricetes sp.]|nr:MAG TPA: hypothetical protein [Caudoviricetes sp.]